MTNSILKHKCTTIGTISFLALTMILAILSAAPTVNATYVSLNKQHTPQTNLNQGDTITFTITLNVLNEPSGSAIAIRHLNMTDILPAGLTYVVGSETHTPIATFTKTGQQLFWDFGVTTVHTTTPQAVVSFNVTVDTGATGTLVNQVIAEYIENLTGVYSNPGTTDTVIIQTPTPTPPTTGAPSGVGGEIVPVNILQLLAPYLTIAFLVTAGLSSVLIYKHRKRTT
jgi:uncharacterized repeat protein (TIGR01451 family)